MVAETEKRPRRRRGEGSIWKRTDGTYQGKVTINGRRRSVYGKREDDVIVAMQELQVAARKGAVLPTAAGQESLAKYLNRWMETVADPRLRASTAHTYRGFIRNHLIPKLGKYRLVKLTPEHADAAWAEMAKAGLAPATIRQARAILRTALAHAEQRGLVARNVARLSAPPRVVRPELSIFSLEDARKLRCAAEQERLGSLWILVLDTGLRRGEALGLRWRDVNLETCNLKVVQARKSVGVDFDEPKSRNSRRSIYFAAATRRALSEWRCLQSAERGGEDIPDVSSQQSTVPSVVRVRKNGALDVGSSARQYLGALPEDVVGEFKRTMGDESAVFRFREANEVFSPVQLSAEVLKVLRRSVQHSYGASPESAVVTVPAAFDLRQCAATREAAELAGLRNAPLLQEPIAASLAYGYSRDAGDGNWLVYDLGGGTFDLALVGIDAGRIRVIDHEGDNFLGGKDFDWLIVERILLPRLAEEYRIDSFRRDNAERRLPLAILKTLAEEAKIALSAVDSVTITVEAPGRNPLLDDRGEEIDCEIAIGRQEYEGLLGDPVSRTVSMCTKVIDRNQNVRPEAVLLVGGPTLTPFIRARLAADLGSTVPK